MASETYTRILNQLKPYVGERMAQAILLSHCQSLGLSPAELKRENVGPLVQKLGTALKAFVGSARASALTQTIQQQASLCIGPGARKG